MKTEEEKYKDYVEFRKKNPKFFEPSNNIRTTLRMKRVVKKKLLCIELLDKVLSLKKEYDEKIRNI